MIGFDAFRKRIKRGIMDQRDERRGKIFLDDKSLSFFFRRTRLILDSLNRCNVHFDNFMQFLRPSDL